LILVSFEPIKHSLPRLLRLEGRLILEMPALSNALFPTDCKPLFKVTFLSERQLLKVSLSITATPEGMEILARPLEAKQLSPRLVRPAGRAIVFKELVP
jgi:hypothetical protein